MTTRKNRKLNPFSLLIIEPDADQWLLIRSALARSFPEAEPVWVNDAAQVMTYLENSACNESGLPRLIVSELYLPNRETGLNLVATIKAHSLYQFIPLIVLSHSKQLSDVVDSYELGIASYIVKPTTTHQWLACFYTFRRYWLESVTLLPRSLRPTLIGR